MVMHEMSMLLIGQITNVYMRLTFSGNDINIHRTITQKSLYFNKTLMYKMNSKVSIRPHREYTF